MYKSQIRKMVGDMTEQQLILLWNMFLEDTKYNTVHIHRLSNSIVSQVYRLPVVHKNQLSDNHILNLLHFLVRDGLLRDFSISKGDVVEIEVETNYYLLPDILVNRLNLINRGQSYLHRLLYKKDLVTGESYIVDDSLQMDVKIGDLYRYGLSVQEAGKQIFRILETLYENLEGDYESLIFDEENRSMVECEEENHCLTLHFIFRGFNEKQELRMDVEEEIKLRNIKLSEPAGMVLHCNSSKKLEMRMQNDFECHFQTFKRGYYVDSYYYILNVYKMIENLYMKKPDYYGEAFASVKNNMAVLYIVGDGIPFDAPEDMNLDKHLISIKKRVAQIDIFTNDCTGFQFQRFILKLDKEYPENGKTEKAKKLLTEALEIIQDRDPELMEVIRQNLDNVSGKHRQM